MDEITSGTFEGMNAKAGVTGRNARQHHAYLAFGTHRSLDGHGASLDQGGSAKLPVTGGCHCER